MPTGDSDGLHDFFEVRAAASGGRCVFAMVTDPATAGRSVTEQMRARLA
jgi:hypothetical protein